MLYRSLLRPILFRLPPETAHDLALNTLSIAPGLVKRIFSESQAQPSFGKLDRFGLSFKNPVGLAAGFDKNGVALESLAGLGFGFIEAGTVTHHAQPGNPRPRLFRLPKDKALINRAGFDNDGAARFVQRVETSQLDCVLGVSIGKSKIVPLEHAIDDYLQSFETVYPVADYVAVNVSSPNTPGLRELQRPEQLGALLQALQDKNLELSKQNSRPGVTPLLIKLAPELDRTSLEQIVEVALDARVAGLIATNTTTSRSGLRTSDKEVAACGEGGLSGRPLTQHSTSMIASLYQLTRGSLPIIGVGGIFTAEDAWAKICAGASLIQVYTGFIYCGPRIAQDINKGLGLILEREGFRSLDDAIGIRAGKLVRY